MYICNLLPNFLCNLFQIIRTANIPTIALSGMVTNTRVFIKTSVYTYIHIYNKEFETAVGI